MSVPQVFPNDKRSSCYECTGTQSIVVMNKNAKLQCRKFTMFGLMLEIESAVSMTELMDKGLIRSQAIGVDDALFSTTDSLDFTPSSQGRGGLGKNDCGLDPQAPKYRRHEKKGHTERIYVHSKECLNSFISTELQEAVFPNDRYSDGQGGGVAGSAFSDMLVMGARRSMARSINRTDIIGIYQGSDSDSAHYDGILAQAVWAYQDNAYFAVNEYTIDENVLTTGNYLHAKYAGEQRNFLYDSANPTDTAIDSYNTLAELYAAVVAWLNGLTDTGGRKLVDASFYQNSITVAHKWTGWEIDLMLTIDNKPTVDWTKCAKFVGIVATPIQSAMPIDERPFLVKYNRYTVDNILSQLALDIYAAKTQMDMSLLKEGQVWALYIDDRVLSTYNTAKALPTQNTSNGTVLDMFEGGVHTLKALEGTGLWFFTTTDSDGNMMNRNVVHLTDSRGTNTPIFRVDENCDELIVRYDQLHGVLVSDFRLLAANLLCSPFAAKLQAPQEALRPQLPCYNNAVRSTINDNAGSGTCAVNANFRKTAEFINGALYGLYDLDGNLVIYTLNEGDTLPNGAVAITEVHFTDYTTGIPFDQLGSATYNWTVEYSDGTAEDYTGKDLILQFAGNFPLAFNVSLTVEAGNCTDSHYASDDYSENYPFRVEGTCASLDMEILGTIRDMSVYEVTSTAFDTAVTVSGAPDATIDLSANPDANDAAAAAAIINAYFAANDIEGQAAGNGNVLTVVSPSVVFVNIDPSGTPVVFDKVYFISATDTTNYSPNDGLGSVAIKTWCQAASEPVSPTFTALPNLQRLPVCTGDTGWDINAVFTSKLGCTVGMAEITVLKTAVNSAPNGVLNITFVS